MIANSPDKKQILAYLLWLLKEEVFDTELEMSVWKDTAIGNNLSVTQCTSGARLIANHFSGRVYGYPIPSDKSHDHLIGSCSLGHDFAIVGKYLVDYWSQYVYESGMPGILDLTDPKDILIIQKKYLPLTDWKELPIKN